MTDEAEPWPAPAPGTAALQVAALANVSDESRNKFCARLGYLLIQTAKGTVLQANLPRIGAGNISDHLSKVQDAAEKLCRAIEELEDKTVDHGDPNKGLARIYLEAEVRDMELSKAPYRKETFLSLQRERAKALAAATKKASDRAALALPRSKGGRRKGAGGNRVFDWFVGSLHEIAREAGGKLTHYRDRGEPAIVFRGSLRPAIDAMQPHLPREGFFPTNTDLDFALERLSRRANADPAKTHFKN
jgi:hypothetical protein